METILEFYAFLQPFDSAISENESRCCTEAEMSECLQTAKTNKIIRNNFLN